MFNTPYYCVPPLLVHLQLDAYTTTCIVSASSAQCQFYKGRNGSFCSPLIPQPGALSVWGNQLPHTQLHTLSPTVLSQRQCSLLQRGCKKYAHAAFSDRILNCSGLRPQLKTRQTAQPVAQKGRPGSGYGCRRCRYRLSAAMQAFGSWPSDPIHPGDNVGTQA